MDTNSIHVSGSPALTRYVVEALEAVGMNVQSTIRFSDDYEADLATLSEQSAVVLQYTSDDVDVVPGVMILNAATHDLSDLFCGKWHKHAMVMGSDSDVARAVAERLGWDGESLLLVRQ